MPSSETPPSLAKPAIDFGGGKVLALVPQNARAIRAAVAELRAQSPDWPCKSTHKDLFKRYRWRAVKLFAHLTFLAQQLDPKNETRLVQNYMSFLRFQLSELENRLRAGGFKL